MTNRVYRIAIVVASLLPSASMAQRPRDVEAVELAAARHLLDRHPKWIIHLDSAFAAPGTAPGLRAGLRPRDRTMRLADSVRAIVTTQRKAGTINLIVSDPVISGDRATVSVTVSYLHGPGPRNGFYETVEVRLAKQGSEWKIIGETSLGIT